MTNQVFSGFGSHRIILEFTSKLKTGTLVFYPGGRKLFFEKGALVFAGSEVPEEHFAEILVQSNVINKHRLTEVRTKLGKGDSLGKALKNQGLATARQLAYALKQQISQIMVRVIDQAEGECQVLENILPEKLPKLKIHTLSLIIQSLIHAKNADEFANLPIEYTLVPNPQYRSIRNALSFPPVYEDFMKVLDNNKPILSSDLGLELGYDVTIVDRLSYVLNLMGMISIRLRSVSPTPANDELLPELQNLEAPKRTAEDLLPEAFPSKKKSQPVFAVRTGPEEPELLDDDASRYGLNETLTEDDTIPTLTSPLLFPPKPKAVEESDTAPEQAPEPEVEQVQEPELESELSGTIGEYVAPEDRETVPSTKDPFDRDTLPGAHYSGSGQPGSGHPGSGHPGSGQPGFGFANLSELPNFSNSAAREEFTAESENETMPGAAFQPDDKSPAIGGTERTEILNTQEVVMYEPEDEEFSPFYDPPKPKRPWLMVAGVFLTVAGVGLAVFLFLRLREQNPANPQPASPQRENATFAESDRDLPSENQVEPSLEDGDSGLLPTFDEGVPKEATTIAEPAETETGAGGVGKTGPVPVADPDRFDAMADSDRPAPDDFKGHMALSKQHLRSSSRNFSVAFIVACQPETVIEVLANYTEDDIFLFPRSFNGEDCYLLTWGLFSGHDEAANARTDLPGFLKEQSNTPWVVNLSKYL